MVTLMVIVMITVKVIIMVIVTVTVIVTDTVTVKVELQQQPNPYLNPIVTVKVIVIVTVMAITMLWLAYASSLLSCGWIPEVHDISNESYGAAEFSGVLHYYLFPGGSYNIKNSDDL